MNFSKVLLLKKKQDNLIHKVLKTQKSKKIKNNLTMTMFLR